MLTDETTIVLLESLLSDTERAVEVAKEWRTQSATDAVTIAKLRADVARLREALEPFTEPRSGNATTLLSAVDDHRRDVADSVMKARAALEATK